MLAGLLLGVGLTAGVELARGQEPSETVLTTWVPDLEVIFNSALGNLFEAGGEQFTDPELKAFYEKLTGDITGSLATDVEYDPGIPLPEATPAP